MFTTKTEEKREQGVRVRVVKYFRTIVPDQPGEAHRLLAHLADEGVSLLAFNAIPLGPAQTQFLIFPESPDNFARAAGRIGLHPSEPQRALLVQGDDRLGALVEIHELLFEADINVYGSNGVTDGSGGFGYVLYVRPEDFDRAVSTLGVR